MESGPKSPSLNALRSHNWFAINILAHDQEPLCRQFATPSTDKFANVKFDVGETGVPVLHGTAAYLECSTYARYPGGDHEIYLGELRAMRDRGFRRLCSIEGQSDGDMQSTPKCSIAILEKRRQWGFVKDVAHWTPLTKYSSRNRTFLPRQMGPEFRGALTPQSLRRDRGAFTK